MVTIITLMLILTISMGFVVATVITLPLLLDTAVAVGIILVLIKIIKKSMTGKDKKKENNKEA